MTRASYLDIIYKKTACLIGVSASAGALAVGASREKQALMRKFGESIGMAFQIQDDILDYTRTARTGKPSNNDLREHKVTLPLLTVLESVGEERRRELLARLARCHEEDESVEYLQHIVENEGGMEKGGPRHAGIPHAGDVRALRIRTFRIPRRIGQPLCLCR